jgi:membrane fusion protein (multidrug efflux system)
MESQAKPRRRAFWWWGGSVVAIALIATVGFATRRGASASAKTKAAETTPAAPVELATARHGPISTFLQNTTTLEARRSAALIARRQGQVMAIPVEEGMWVEKGATLVQLDDHEASLAVQRTELALEVAKRELERGKQLDSRGYLSAKEIDDLELRLENARVELEQARYDRSQMRITAPFAGRIVQRTVQLGETVTEGRECFRIDDFDPILARIYFPERDLARVRVGQEAVLTLDAQPGVSFPARVSLVNPVVDRANGTIKVTLEIPNRDGRLRPGAFGRVRLKTGEAPQALLVPRRALISEDGESYVFVARGDSVVRRTVQVGAVEGDDAQLLGGLSAGDRVVTVGQGGLKPGTRIKAVTL